MMEKPSDRGNRCPNYPYRMDLVELGRSRTIDSTDITRDRDNDETR